MFSTPSGQPPNTFGLGPFPIVASVFLLVLLGIGLTAAQFGITGSSEIIFAALASIVLLVKTWMGAQKTKRKPNRP